ncbi:hypothetical protein J5N97_005614 [Dioscorea zingiberensis]|uniref:Vacuolar protein 14 C-terminal Fig4-binding domain-containing protein n=1 Tax=Dioscorea zingiberensis TaxID=325984 RepID=A0A9D5HSG6_9LILI|nr:hypothetical protein J5N97_005614 [Dioscorea zingiberensis]
MLSPSSNHRSDEFTGIPSCVLSNLGDELLETRIRALYQLFYFVSKPEFKSESKNILALADHLSKEFMNPSQPSYRKQGGLIGLTVLMVALRKELAHLFLPKVLPPVLYCLRDQDRWVRESAGEALCEIAVIVKGEIFVFFDYIFSAISSLTEDPGRNFPVSNKVLDRILKCSATKDGEFRIEEFIHFLKETMNKVSYDERLFLLRWIGTTLPHHLESQWFYLELIEVAFHGLRQPKYNERQTSAKDLAEILYHIKTGEEKVDFDHLAKRLLHFACLPDQLSQFTALTWVACEINEGISKAHAGPAKSLNINSVLSVLTSELSCAQKDTRIEALHWIAKLLAWHRAVVVPYFNDNFDILIKALSDPSDEVVLLVLEVHACIARDASTQFHRLFVFLVQNFQTDRSFLLRQGSLIVSQLCALLNAEQVYLEFSSVLDREDNLEFASQLVQMLNFVLITASELADMRALLKQTLVNAGGRDLFLSLYSSWCHSASATISLCLLVQAYRHATHVILSFVEEEDMNMISLTELADLVNLLETPCFDYINQLLEAKRSLWLWKALHCLFMLQPQETVASNLLMRRLRKVPAHSFVCARFECFSCKPKPMDTLQLADPSNENQDTENKQDAINFASLLEQFKNIQRKHFKHAKTKTQLQPYNSASSA